MIGDMVIKSKFGIKCAVEFFNVTDIDVDKIDKVVIDFYADGVMEYDYDKHAVADVAFVGVNGSHRCSDIDAGGFITFMDKKICDMGM